MQPGCWRDLVGVESFRPKMQGPTCVCKGRSGNWRTGSPGYGVLGTVVLARSLGVL